MHNIIASVTDSGGLSGSYQISITVTPFTFSFLPSDDASVYSNDPSGNFGALETLKLRNQNKQKIHIYLKFIVVGLSGSVSSAKLRLYVSKGRYSGGSIYAVSNNYLNTSNIWTEDGLSWDNAPTIGGTPLATLGPVVSGTWVEIDLTQVFPGDGVYSFGLLNSSSNRVAHHAIEAVENQPVLIIE